MTATLSNVPPPPPPRAVSVVFLFFFFLHCGIGTNSKWQSDLKPARRQRDGTVNVRFRMGHCYCQISGELKPWHAGNPPGVACVSVRWKKKKKERKRLWTRRKEAHWAWKQLHTLNDSWIQTSRIKYQSFKGGLYALKFCNTKGFYLELDDFSCSSFPQDATLWRKRKVWSFCAGASTGLSDLKVSEPPSRMPHSSVVAVNIGGIIKPLLADAWFLSSGSKHRQHYQRPQLAPLSIKSPLS